MDKHYTLEEEQFLDMSKLLFAENTYNKRKTCYAINKDTNEWEFMDIDKYLSQHEDLFKFDK